MEKTNAIYTEDLNDSDLKGAKVYVRSSEDFIEYTITILVTDDKCVQPAPIITWKALSKTHTISTGKEHTFHMEHL